jgi:hypothetical protein
MVIKVLVIASQRIPESDWVLSRQIEWYVSQTSMDMSETECLPSPLFLLNLSFSAIPTFFKSDFDPVCVNCSFKLMYLRISLPYN